MFGNSGKKIKSIAKVVFVISIIIVCVMLTGDLIVAFNMRFGGGEVLAFYSILHAIIVFIVVWIISLFMSAFGDLVESNNEVVNLLHIIKDSINGSKVENNKNQFEQVANNSVQTTRINQLEHAINNSVQATNISQFCYLIDKYEMGEISKEELIKIKNDNWFKIVQTFKNSTSREKVKMINACEEGLISSEEYEAYRCAIE